MLLSFSLQLLVFFVLSLVVISPMLLSGERKWKQIVMSNLFIIGLVAILCTVQIPNLEENISSLEYEKVQVEKQLSETEHQLELERKGVQKSTPYGGGGG